MSYDLRSRVSWHRTMGDLKDMFRKWAIREQDWRVMCDAKRTDGYGSRDDRRVTISYRHPGGREVVLSMDRQDRPMDNLRVLYLALDAIRLNEVRGLAEVMEQAYLQLAAPTAARDPYEVLGIRSDTPLEVAEAAYKALAKSAHSDVGGDDSAMKELNAAIERVREERSVPA